MRVDGLQEDDVKIALWLNPPYIKEISFIILLLLREAMTTFCPRWLAMVYRPRLLQTVYAFWVCPSWHFLNCKDLFSQQQLIPRFVSLEGNGGWCLRSVLPALEVVRVTTLCHRAVTLRCSREGPQMWWPRRIAFLCGTTDLTICIWERAYCFLPVISYITAFKNNPSYASIFILMSFCPRFFLSVLKWDQMLFHSSSRLSIELKVLLLLENSVSHDSFCLLASPDNAEINQKHL